MTFLTGQPCPVPGCKAAHGVIATRPATRPTQERLEGAGASNRGPASPESPDSQPVGASAPERRSPGLPATG